MSLSELAECLLAPCHQRSSTSNRHPASTRPAAAQSRLWAMFEPLTAAPMRELGTWTQKILPAFPVCDASHTLIAPLWSISIFPGPKAQTILQCWGEPGGPAWLTRLSLPTTNKKIMLMLAKIEGQLVPETFRDACCSMKCKGRTSESVVYVHLTKLPPW